MAVSNWLHVVTQYELDSSNKHKVLPPYSRAEECARSLNGRQDDESIRAKASSLLRSGLQKKRDAVCVPLQEELLSLVSDGPKALAMAESDTTTAVSGKATVKASMECRR